MKQIILLLALLQLNYITMAQRKVKSASYNILLKTMLKHSVPEISVDSMAALKTMPILLDAREENEYKVSHIANAMYVGYNKFDISSIATLNKNAAIIVYCSVGYRSEKITEKLIAKGFTNVSNLYGGIFEWRNLNKGVVDTIGKPTNNVHAYNKTWGKWLHNSNKIYNSN